MIKKNNESLSKHTTIEIGGFVKEYIIPETTDELINVIQTKHPKYFIGGGSNLLINDREFDLVVSLNSFNRVIISLDEKGLYHVGGSVRLQKLIKTINDDGYGGIEYLFSVPGLVGGAICMNAGRGKKQKKSIADYLISVDVLKGNERIKVTKEQCRFRYRDSIFKGGGFIILSAVFRFPKQEKYESKQLIHSRIQWCKDTQDNSKPNFGTVFSTSNKVIMKIFKFMKYGQKNGIRFSGKTSNWLLNTGNGTYKDAIKVINRVELLHKMINLKCKREVVTWE